MSPNWTNLRSWNGSQRAAFEELCCQLARAEDTPDGSCFVRKGSPDAGVECFWILADDSEWGWQAKFFDGQPDAQQWGQIDDSVKRALNKHPGLTRYYVCLPVDFSDARREDQTSSLQKWEQRVEKWSRWASKRNMSVDFVLWGESEIWDRLSRDEHSGRSMFWFNENHFSTGWFEDRLEETLADAGARYSPELNVELPIARLFDALGRTDWLYDRFEGFLRTFNKLRSDLRSGRLPEAAEEELGRVLEEVCEVTDLLRASLDIQEGDFPYECITEAASNVQSWANELSAELRGQQTDDDGRNRTGGTDPVDSALRTLRKLDRQCSEVRKFAESRQAQLANGAGLLLVGEGGVGKTHLLCDVAEKRLSEGLPTVLILGEKFRDGEPWTQITHKVDRDCSAKEFLGALEAAAEAHGRKALLMIDALNEAKAPEMWYKYLGSLLTKVRRYPWVGVALSVRTSYERVVIPDHLVGDKLLRERHQGFVERGYEACREFFDHYGIQHSSIPLMRPEFKNPLFLKLFCEALENRGRTTVPSGLSGITSVFEYYLDSLDDKLSRPDRLNYGPERLVHRAVDAFAARMADTRQTKLPKNEAKEIVDELDDSDGYFGSLFHALIDEGVLSKNMYYAHESQPTEIIQFSYERFADHTVVKHLLDDHLDPENPTESFSRGQPLGELIADERSILLKSGFIEALMIQLPEMVGVELFELIPEFADHPAVINGFLHSLIWRNPTALSDAALVYINEHVLQDSHFQNQFLEAVLTVACMPEHPYNAEFLHRNLDGRDLAERDEWWSIYLYEIYRTEAAVDRLIDWAWSEADKSHIDDESIHLCATALTWFLTTSSRPLRDDATKALVSLLSPRIGILCSLLRKFNAVNDPYVSERLYAVAYGCAMRSRDDEAVRGLAETVYELVFEEGSPPADIMLRDYARGIVELAMDEMANLDFDINKVRPPYESVCLGDVPAAEDIANLQTGGPGMRQLAWSLLDRKAVGGDFSRKVIGRTPEQFYREAGKAGYADPMTRKEIYLDFVTSLDAQQRKAWEAYKNSREAEKNEPGRLDVEVDDDSSSVEQARSFIERAAKAAQNESEEDGEVERKEAAFRKMLDETKETIFEQHVLSYLNSSSTFDDGDALDGTIARRWMFKRVLDLGWTEKRFGDFDSNVAPHGFACDRSGNKRERIGKKYQWIAYHEFLARATDNFEYRPHLRSEDEDSYAGPWQFTYLRDIDPSCLLRQTARDVWNPDPNNWWFEENYCGWRAVPEDEDWLQKTDDLPDPENIICNTGPEREDRWLTLEGFYRWTEPPSPGQDPRFPGRRELWYMLRSYLVAEDDLSRLYDWAKDRDFMGRWMPESHELLDVFLGEYFWSPAYTYHDRPYYHHEGWTQGVQGRIPVDVLVTSERYLWEDGVYDCSIDESISLHFPCQVVVDEMGLDWEGAGSVWVDAAGRPIVLDPSVDGRGPGALVVRKNVFEQFLSGQGYAVVWTLLGEKMVHSDRFGGNDIGCLEISGAYTLSDREVQGQMIPRFQPYPVPEHDKIRCD